MGFGIKTELNPQKIGELREGDVFIAHLRDAGRLIGIIGGNESERLLVILGSERTRLDGLQVGWFKPEPLHDELAYKIDGARIAVSRNERGYAEVIAHYENGCVVLDANDRPWIYTEADNSRVHFNLETGLAGAPTKPVRRYADWQIIWTPPGEEEAVLLWTHSNPPASD